MIRVALLAAGLFATPAVVYLSLGSGSESTSQQGQFVIPNLSSFAHDGREHFAASCGRCHGAYGEGTDNGPMLVHSLYASTIFDDTQIVNAVTKGATARHWPFGDMPVIDAVTQPQLDQIIVFLREVQQANGIN